MAKTVDFRARNVNKIDVDFIDQMVDKKTIKWRKGAISKLVETQRFADKIGLNGDLVKKLEMALNIKNKGKGKDEKMTMERMFEGMVVRLLTNTVKESQLKEAGVKPSKNLSTAKMRVEHFVNNIKEHNKKSKYTIMVTKSTAIRGLGTKEDMVIDESLLKCSDKQILVNGTNANRKAINSFFAENGNFVEYNMTLGSDSSRLHNTRTLSNLYKTL